jgi:hypothetical protein
MHLNDKRCPDVVFICISEKYGSTAIYEPFHTYFKVICEISTAKKKERRKTNRWTFRVNNSE